MFEMSPASLFSPRRTPPLKWLPRLPSLRTGPWPDLRAGPPPGFHKKLTRAFQGFQGRVEDPLFSPDIRWDST